MRVGDIIEPYAERYVVVTATRTDEAGKPEVKVLDESGNSYTWTERPTLRTPDRYMKVSEGCNPSVNALNHHAEKYLRK